MTIAVVFVPTAHVIPFAKQCLDYCAGRGYEIAGVVRDDWPAAFAMMATGLVDVIVVARREHLDPNRTPRVEILAEVDGESRPSNLSNRRPRLNQNRQSVDGLRARRAGDGDVQLGGGYPGVPQ